MMEAMKVSTHRRDSGGSMNARDAIPGQENSSTRQPDHGLISALPVPAFATTLDGAITTWNRAAERLFGRRSEDIIGSHASLLQPRSGRSVFRRLLADIAARQYLRIDDGWLLGSDGLPFPVEINAAPLIDDDRVTGALWLVRNLTEQYALESVVWEQTERAETAYAMVSDALILTDVEGRVTYLNPIAERVLGVTSSEVQLQPVGEIIRLIEEASHEPVQSPVERALLESEPVDVASHNLLVAAGGSLVPVTDAAAPVRNREGAVCGVVMVLRLHDEQSTSQSVHPYVSGTDATTGLLNTREFEHQLDRALVSAARENAVHSLLALEIVGFRRFSAHYGAAATDELLRHVGVLLRTQVRDLDVTARLHDDEFLVLLSHCPIAQGRRVAEQIARTLESFPLMWEGRIHRVLVRIGVIPVTADSGPVQRMMQIAQIVCQTAEFDGVDRIHVLDVGDVNRATASKRWDRSKVVSRAFHENRFRLYGQRIQPLRTDAGDGEQVEILVHLIDEDGQLLGPGIFLPAARRAGLMSDVDRWVVRSLFEMLREHARPGIHTWTLNLSAESVNDPDFPENVQRLARQYGVQSRRICFEIDETLATTHFGDVQRVIDSLRPAGFKFALSHFGSGPNSFAYLRNLAIDFVKIDGSYSRDVAEDQVDRAIVSAIVEVAHAVGARTIAEHVEDPTVLELLRDLGVDYVQGYAIADPLPALQLS